MNMINKTILILFSLVALFCSCKGDGEKDCCKKEGSSTLSTGIIPSESLFNISSAWQTQHGDTIALNHLKNKISVVAMVFTHCESACPRIVADMQRIEKSFSEVALKQINFVLISMDPARDTPERFREFAKDHQLNDNWTLLRSDESATMEIANVLNVRVKKLSDGGFDHSNSIFVLNQHGVVAHQQNGLEQEPSETIKITKLLLETGELTSETK